MPLHIEISGTLEPREWDAIATLAHLFGGTALGSTVVPAPPAAPKAAAPAPAPEAAPAPVPAPPPPPPPPGVTAQEIHPNLPVTSGVLTDKDGLPWDARIHVSTKTTTKEGRWTSKRNLNAEFKAGVEAELRKVMAAAPPPPPPPTTDAEIAAAFPAAGAEPAPIVPAPPPPPPPPAPDTVAMGDTPFQSLMKKILARQTAGTLTTAVVLETAQACGLTGITDLAKRPDLIPTFEALLPA